MIEAIMTAGPEGWGLIRWLCADPGTLSLIAMGVSAAGSVVNGIVQNNAAQASADANEQNAKMAAAVGAQREAAARNDARRLQGQQLATAGANGVTLSGSALDYTLDTAVETELAALNERFAAGTQADAYRTEAAQNRMAGKSALYGGFISGAAELAGGMAKFRAGGSTKSGGFNGYGSYLGVGRG